NQEHLLPKFAPVQKPPVAGPEQRAETVNQEVVAPNPTAAPAEKPADVQPPRPGNGRSTGRKGAVALLKRLKPKWLQRGKGQSARMRKSVGPPVQAELSLDTVKVVRNDLSDSDFALVPQEGAGGKATSTRQPLGMVWNRLSARLLRQAAEEF